MRQFVLPATWDGGPACELSARDSRRLTVVLRLGKGDSFPAIGPDGASCLCTIEQASRGHVILAVRRDDGREPAGSHKPDVRARHLRAGRDNAVEEAQASAAPRLPRIVLAVGMLKGSMLDDVVRAAAEAGTSAIIPLITTRTIPGQASQGKMERLRRVVSEAIGQSGTDTPTLVAEPMTIERLCSEYPSSPGRRICLFFHETPLAQATIHRYCNGILEEMVICVGPEGGFDNDEVAFFLERGFVPAWLGPNVLRAGTAAVFAIASLRIVCLERSSWSMIESKE